MPNLKQIITTERPSLLIIAPCLINFLFIQKTFQELIFPNFTYTMKEEIIPPYNLGNLITDLKLRSIISINDLQPQSLSFLPSNQFGSKFLTIVFHSYLYQYLTLTRVFDREINCDLLSTKTISKVSTNKCICQNYDPFRCYFYIVLVLAPVHHSNMVFILQIFIDDINDNSPQFTKKEIQISIPEDAQLNSRFPLPVAEDQDWNLNAVIDYKSFPNDSFDIIIVDRFSINQTLYMTIKTNLDREIAQNYTLIIIASDRGTEISMSTSLTVQITVLDVNDCSPTFTDLSIKPLYISEDIFVPSQLLIVNATDLDIGDNGQITYSLEIQPFSNLAQTFSINPSNGEIRIISKPDREKQAFFTLIIWAQDHGSIPRSSSVKVSVNIIDVNDNDPIINGPSNLETYENNKTPLIISTYRITDLDIHHNISCTIAKNQLENSVFQLKRSKSMISQESVYHLITQHIFDRESQSDYNITLICRDDFSDISRVSSLTISLTILDLNDNSPELSKNYNLSFRQNESYLHYNNDCITQISAIDKDIGLNSQIEYFIIHSDQQAFTVHLITGKLFQLNSLDYEKGSKCFVVIGARDSGNPSLTSSLTLTFDIIDTNDNAPHYDGPTIVSIAENNLIGTVLIVLNISDKDSGLSGMTTSILTYKSDEFSLVENQLVALVSFDREKQNEYSVKFKMKDFGEPPLISIQELVIKILDVNDNHPTILYPSINQTMVFAYNHYFPRQKIFQVTAVDSDEGLNSNLRFFIEPYSEFFQIDFKTGWISLKQYLSSSNIGNLSINLVVRDCGINALETNGVIIFVIINADSVSWMQMRSFLYIHKWIFLTFLLALIIIIFLILSVYFSREGKFSKIQKSIRNNRYFGLNSFPQNDFELQLANQKYLSKCKNDDLMSECLYEIHNFNDQNENDMSFQNGIVKNLNIMVHNSAVSNSDSGHGESAESRLLIDALPHIEVIPRQQPEIYPHRPIQYSIDWKSQQSPPLENLRLPESNSIGILNSLSDELRYENMNFEL